LCVSIEDNRKYGMPATPSNAHPNPIPTPSTKRKSRYTLMYIHVLNSRFQTPTSDPTIYSPRIPSSILAGIGILIPLSPRATTSILSVVPMIHAAEDSDRNAYESDEEEEDP